MTVLFWIMVVLTVFWIFFLHIPDYALDDRGRRPCFSMDISSDCVFSCANYNFALFTY